MELNTTGLLEGLFDFLYLFKGRTMSATCIRNNPDIAGIGSDMKSFLETHLSRKDAVDMKDMLSARLRSSDCDVRRFEYTFSIGKRIGVICGATVRIEPYGLYLGINLIAENSPKNDYGNGPQSERLKLLASDTGIISFEYLLNSDTMIYSFNEPGEKYSEHRFQGFLKDDMEADGFMSPLRSMTASAVVGTLPEESVFLLGDESRGKALYRVRMISLRDGTGEVSSVFGKAERLKTLQQSSSLYSYLAGCSSGETRMLASLSFDVDSGRLLRQDDSLIPGVLGDLDTFTACIARISTLIHPDYLERFICITAESLRHGEETDCWTRELVCRLHLSTGPADVYHTCLLNFAVDTLSAADGRRLHIDCFDVSDVREYMSTGVVMRRDELTGLFVKDSFREGLLSGDIGGIRESDIDAAAIVQLDDYDLIQKFTSITEFDDLVLNLAERLMSETEGRVLSCRLGDATFGLVFVRTPNAAFIRNRLQSILGRMSVELPNGFTSRVSIGCYMSFWNEQNTYDEMMDMARKALLRSRQGGGGRITYYSEDSSGEVSSRGKSVFIRTFGSFDIFINGRPVSFSSRKAKELLALLVDRRGGSITNREVLAILWPDSVPDDSTKQKCRKAAYNLSRTLKENGIEYILKTDGRERALNIEEVRCDYYEYLAGINMQEFTGAYLDEYSWSETTLAELMYKKGVNS